MGLLGRATRCGTRAARAATQDLTLREAAVWGLERTPRVLVRAETSGYLAVGPDASRYVVDDGVEGQLTVAALDGL